MFVGVAPLGTSLTEEQAGQLARLAHEHHATPVVATDADLAGQVAAQRDYWLLAQHGLPPHTVLLRPGTDPADLLALHGPDALRCVLQNQGPLAEVLIADRLTHLTGLSAARHAAAVLAADDPSRWEKGLEHIAGITNVPASRVQRELAEAVRRWDTDPRNITGEQITDLSTVRARLTPTCPKPDQRDHTPARPPAPPPAPARRVDAQPRR